MKNRKACETPTANLSNEQINEDLERAARASSMILALTKGITDCNICAELAILLALAAILDYNESEPQRIIGLLQSLMEDKNLMETVFNSGRLTAIPVETLAGAMTPRNPKDIQ